MNQTNVQIAAKIAAALNERGRAKPYPAEQNPYANHDLRRMAQGKGVRKFSDQLPAKNMAEHGGAALEMEQQRIAGLKDGSADKSAQRMRVARARAARKQQLDKIVDSPVQPDSERMTHAWAVVFPLVPIITKIADSKQRWASRYLGSIGDDVAQQALEKTALVLAKSDHDLGVLKVAADELGGMVQRTGQIPGDQMTDEQRKERRQIAKARKWLMGLCNNRVMGALVDAYTDRHNLRWDNIDMIATVMASINGAKDDPLIASTKADRAPAMLGTKFPRPGSIDPALLSQAITGAITDRRLDAVVEILLHEDNRRTDGAVKWGECAEALFLAAPDAGAWAWDAVVKATEHHARPSRARGDAARTYVRELFAWLPGHIVAVVAAFDYYSLGYVLGQRLPRAVMTSDFESFYIGDASTVRQPLQPALRFTDAAEAAQVLTEHLSVLLTGDDLVKSVVFA